MTCTLGQNQLWHTAREGKGAAGDSSISSSPVQAPLPRSPPQHSHEELGRGAKCCPYYTSVFPVCSPASPPPRGAGFNRSPSALALLPHPSYGSASFFLLPLLPLSHVYFSALLLHPIHLSLFPSHLSHPERLVRRRKSEPSFSQLYLPNKAWSQVLFKKRKMNWMQVGQKKRPRIKRMTAKRRLSEAGEAEHPLGKLDTSSRPAPSPGAAASAALLISGAKTA